MEQRTGGGIMKFKVYAYPIHDGKRSYYGTYTIKETAKPLGFKNEKQIQEFEAEVK